MGGGEFGIGGSYGGGSAGVWESGGGFCGGGAAEHTLHSGVEEETAGAVVHSDGEDREAAVNGSRNSEKSEEQVRGTFVAAKGKVLSLNCTWREI